ncbi:MAG: hypothetical protein WCJ30_23135 [Deltaproteobacteria bacterium]
MIPAVDELVAGYPFVARRHGRVAHFDRGAVESAVQLATDLAAGLETDGPGASFWLRDRFPQR